MSAVEISGADDVDGCDLYSINLEYINNIIFHVKTK